MDVFEYSTSSMTAERNLRGTVESLHQSVHYNLTL